MEKDVAGPMRQVISISNYYILFLSSKCERLTNWVFSSESEEIRKRVKFKAGEEGNYNQMSSFVFLFAVFNLSYLYVNSQTKTIQQQRRESIEKKRREARDNLQEETLKVKKRKQSFLCSLLWIIIWFTNFLHLRTCKRIKMINRIWRKRERDILRSRGGRLVWDLSRCWIDSSSNMSLVFFFFVF